MLAMFVFLCCGAYGQAAFEGIELVNAINWPRYFNEMLGYQYESRGNIHFYPSDIYLLYKTIPAKTLFTIEKYRSELPYPLDRVPYFSEITNSEEDIDRHAGLFKNSTTELMLYPALNILIIKVNGSPYAKIAVRAGTPYDYLPALEVEKDKPVVWDFTLAEPTQPGSYEVLAITNRYLSGSYYKDTVVPFGAWMRKIGGVWCYQDNGWWYTLPAYIAEDIEKEAGKRTFNYFDWNAAVPAARWAGNDFGKYVLLWTKDGVYRQRQMGYAPGDLLYEQIMLAKETVRLLTQDGPNDLKYFIQKNENDPRVLSVLPRDREARRRALGLYHYFKQNNLLAEKSARLNDRLRKNWPFLMELKKKLADDFTRMGVLSIENRQNILEEWLSERLEFRKAVPPAEAKYISPLAFTTFFRPEERISTFTARESAVMREHIRKILSGEAAGIDLESVNALNNYNFGRLLNEILGDLYKSHGCLHVSPRNSYFLYEILPIGAKMNIHKYSENISPEAIAEIPLLSDLVNFADDLNALKDQLSATSEVKIEVFPSSGFWILYLKDKPFARLSVKGGPRASFNMVQGRDAAGKPVFEKNLAFPTTPGKYYIYKKVTDYISNLYRDTTIIPMGGIIRRGEKGWENVPKAIADDLSRPPEAREYVYYDSVRNASDEVVEVKWGSHPFGKYAIQTTVDKVSAFPELIHSSGGLIMEERQIIDDLIALLSVPYDKLEDCVNYDPNFMFYKNCYDFTLNPASGEAIGLKERAHYKLYYSLPLSTEEAAVPPADLFVVNKIVRGMKPDSEEAKVLIKSGLAVRPAVAGKQQGKLVINWRKVNGLHFDLYQYAVALQKYANHYAALKNYWDELDDLRRAMLRDFNSFVIKDPALFHGFMRELMLARTRLEKIDQQKAFKILDELISRANL